MTYGVCALLFYFCVKNFIFAETETFEKNLFIPDRYDAFFLQIG